MEGRFTPAWVGAIAMLVAAVLVEAVRAGVLPLQAWALPLPALLVGAAAFLLTSLHLDGWPAARAMAARLPGPALAAVWMPWAGYAGWHSATLGTWLIGGAACTLVAVVAEPAPKPAPARGVQPVGEPAGRPGVARDVEQVIREQTGWNTATVTKVTPWPKGGGDSIHLRLPAGKTVRQLAEYREALQSAWELPPSCAVQIRQGAHQGLAVLDRMLVDTLAKPVDLPLTDRPVSINDPFPLLVDAQGTQLDVCLREHSAVIGGAPGSGKTTLLHRIIARLAWCTDTLIWVLDMNGGGLAEPWIRPWARGEAERPVVDWVAGDEAEAAVMVATLAAIAKDRKMSHETIEAKERGGTNILPVSAELPAIILITDEGGEIAQAAGLLGRLANQGVARIAQIGRAEGTRVVMSVLRGTADLLSKGMRVMAWIRIALAMTEEDEYSPVLGLTPGRATLVHRGSAWLRRIGTDERPILARSADMQRPTIARVAVASAKYRTNLDRRGQLVAQLLRPRDVFDGRDPADFPDEAATDALRDVAEGRAYAGRWDRMADRLAAMRGERVAPRVTESRPVSPPPADALEAFLGAPVATLVAEPESADEAREDPAGRPAREYILDVLRDARPDGLMSGQIGNLIGQRGKQISRGHRHEVLAELVAAGQIVVRAGVYHLPEDVTP